MTAVWAALAGFGLALITTPAGVSGAVLLLPFQVSVLGVPSPSVTPTNLLFNVLATPGAIVRYARTGALGGPLARTLVAGTLPGVVIGAVVRVELLPGERGFLLVVACVLLPLGLWLLLGEPAAERAHLPAARTLWPLAFGVGIVGGIYGVGGGSMLAPILLALGLSVRTVAGPALLSTFVTSVAGVATFAVLAATHEAAAPDWAVGIGAGLGGLAGGYVGARLQPRVPERALRRLLGALAVLIAVRYAWVALT